MTNSLPKNPANHSISRRDILRTLAVTAAAGSVLQIIPAEAAAFVHQSVHQAKSASPTAKYSPKFFSAHQYATLSSLCATIIPADDKSAGALEAGAPEFIDLITSENEKYQLRLGGGLQWLDSASTARFSSNYLNSTTAQRTELLDLIAFRRNAKKDPALRPGIAFFSLLRALTCDAFYTSKIGIADLQYIGNTALPDFPGCPPLPTSSTT